MSEKTTGFHYQLVECDNDGAIHSVEVNDCQVRFNTWFALGTTVGKIEISLTDQQVNTIKTWWRGQSHR